MGFECPYSDDEDGGCRAVFSTAAARLEHMRSPIHAEATQERVQRLGKKAFEGWKLKGSCHRLEFVTEANSVSRRAALAGEFVKPSRKEAACISLCAGCPVRRQCATASLQPPPH